MSHEAEACRQLWVAVLVVAVRDLVLPNRINADAARAWIGGRDFREVCEMAGYSPQAVQRRLRRLAEAAPTDTTRGRSVIRDVLAGCAA